MSRNTQKGPLGYFGSNVYEPEYDKRGLLTKKINNFLFDDI